MKIMLGGDVLMLHPPRNKDERAIIFAMFNAYREHKQVRLSEVAALRMLKHPVVWFDYYVYDMQQRRLFVLSPDDTPVEFIHHEVLED